MIDHSGLAFLLKQPCLVLMDWFSLSCWVAGAALSSHAGRQQRALPDKRARRKPGWLDGTIDPKMAAQLATQQATGLEVGLRL